MLLETLSAENFRNLAGTIETQPGLNVLVGENGQGKTNWLEAIEVLASGTSFRTSRLVETIRFGESAAYLSGTVRESVEITRRLRVALTGNAKALLVNGKKETLQRYITNLHAIVFNSDELEIVRGGPDPRRRFLDEGIVSLHPPFVQVLADYSRVIRQKNALLQSFADKAVSIDEAHEALQPWNEQLIKLAGRIYRARVRFVKRINEVLEKKLFGREELSIRYVSSLEGKGDLDDFESLVTERLKIRVQAEVASGYALIGTHRDDMDMSFDGHDLRKYGSSGQQRSALLLLQLANIAVFHATRGEYPLFLIDDIDAELDYRRIGHLLEFLAGKTQLFVSTSKESFVERFGAGASIFNVHAGTAKVQ